MNAKMNVMDLQAEIKWINTALLESKDPTFIKAVKNMIKSMRNVKESSYEISEEHKLILDQRLAEHAANPNSGRSWNEVKSDLQAKYGI